MSLKRKALIICSNLASDPLPGVPRDAGNWESFLESNAGGAWESKEILLLNNPSHEKILWAKAIFEGVDYGITVFLGHGYVENDMMDIPETFLVLNENEVISERELNPGTPKYLSIVDCCRKYEAIEESVTFSKIASFGEFSDRPKVRKLFEEAVLKAEAGWDRLYAAEIGQAAADAVSFSDILLKNSINWSKDNTGVLSTKQGHQLVSDSFKTINPQQTPIHHAGRRRDYFPLAIGQNW